METIKEINLDTLPVAPYLNLWTAKHPHRRRIVSSSLQRQAHQISMCGFLITRKGQRFEASPVFWGAGRTGKKTELNQWPSHPLTAGKVTSENE